MLSCSITVLHLIVQHCGILFCFIAFFYLAAFLYFTLRHCFLLSCSIVSVILEHCIFVILLCSCSIAFYYILDFCYIAVLLSAILQNWFMLSCSNGYCLPIYLPLTLQNYFSTCYIIIFNHITVSLPVIMQQCFLPSPVLLSPIQQHCFLLSVSFGMNLAILQNYFLLSDNFSTAILHTCSMLWFRSIFWYLDSFFCHLATFFLLSCCFPPSCFIASYFHRCRHHTSPCCIIASLCYLNHRLPPCCSK
jgi:hypothetical protein